MYRAYRVKHFKRVSIPSRAPARSRPQRVTRRNANRRLLRNMAIAYAVRNSGEDLRRSFKSIVPFRALDARVVRPRLRPVPVTKAVSRKVLRALPKPFLKALPKRQLRVASGVRFVPVLPADAVVCVRRRVRREVIHALGHAGANKAGRRGPNSNVVCR